MIDIDLLRAERAVLKAKGEIDAFERQQAAYEAQGLTRVARLAAKRRRNAAERHAAAVANVEALRSTEPGARLK